MAIFRGVGGSGDSSDNSYLQEVTAQANAASASASAASASAVLAQASANSILTLTAATGDAGTDVSYNASTGVLTVPRGADGTDASVTAANVTGVLTGGTGISIASNGTITNDSPDQTVALTGTGATTITGTYPNFTIDSTNTTYTVGDGGLTTNDFTDADHSKLDGIEASADVTDTVNVTAAGALMTTGGQLTGDITFSGTQTVDGRDLSVDGAKLDGIEANATADQTGAEIKTAYEAEADTNAFTDADHSKLDNIEANADVTDTANVTSAGAAMLSSSPTFTGTITAPNVDISTTGSVTTNIASGGNNGNATDVKVVNIGTGYGNGFYAGDSTTINMGSQASHATNIFNIGNGTTSGTGENTINLKGNVTVDGTLNGGTYERTFTSMLVHDFTANLNLSTTLTRLGYTYSSKETTGSKNTFDLTLETKHSDLYDTNDAEYYVSLTAPASSAEDVVSLGSILAVVSDTSKAKKIGYFDGDKTKYLSEYCGLALASNGTSALNTNGLTYYYDATNDRTYMGVHLYQANNFTTGDTIYLHPFDWESTGTVLNGKVTPLDAAVYDGMVESVHTKKHYLGYFKSNVNIEVRAQEPSSNTDGNIVAVKKLEGALNQVQD